jgi:hypothetical protein
MMMLTLNVTVIVVVVIIILVYCTCECMEVLPLTRIGNFQELHLHGNDMGNEGIREFMVGLMAHKGILLCTLV